MSTPNLATVPVGRPSTNRPNFGGVFHEFDLVAFTDWQPVQSNRQDGQRCAGANRRQSGTGTFVLASVGTLFGHCVQKGLNGGRARPKESWSKSRNTGWHRKNERRGCGYKGEGLSDHFEPRGPAHRPHTAKCRALEP